METTWHLDRFLIDLKTKLFQLNTGVERLPCTNMCVLIKDGNHWTLLCLYYATSTHYLQVGDLMFADALDVDSTVSGREDSDVCPCYTTIGSAVNQ